MTDDEKREIMGRIEALEESARARLSEITQLQKAIGAVQNWRKEVTTEKPRNVSCQPNGKEK